jgi:alanine-glyoxylate transaminase/serine-glyoxylate transaminase/serine-pyruvate transaminase
MHQAAPNIYEGELTDITDSILSDLEALAGTQGQAALYICNGHGVWEAAISNLFELDDCVLVLNSGRFGSGWADMARVMGLDVNELDFGLQDVVDSAVLRARLLQDRSHRIKAVMMPHTDTASSVRNDLASIRQAIDEAGHPALFLVDAIASFGCDRYEMDEWGIDVTVTACQKGLMTPPGLGYLLFNGKAAAAAERVSKRSPYWDWRLRVDPEVFYQRFCGTAPTHLLFAQRAALDMIKQEGREAIWARHLVLARAVWSAVEAWGSEGPLKCNITKVANRSHAVTTIRVDGHDMAEMRRWCEDKAGLVLGLGLGFQLPEYMEGKSVFRIGHMGHLNPPMLLGALATIDTALKALNIPHGRGAVDAATNALVHTD